MKSRGCFRLPRLVIVALLLCAVGAIWAVQHALTARAVSCPTTCGFYTVSGLGVRKRAILNNGGNMLDMAIAMLETETMQADYPYGDGKSGDAANFGIFKQNWYMLRTSVPQYEPYSTSAFNAGAALNNNLSWDIQCLHDGQNHYGLYNWFAGQRGGLNGLNNPGTTDINNYRNAVYWIQSQIDNGHQTDDVRFWVNIVAV